MTARQTPAIIVQVRDYGEADRLVNFLTPEGGRVTGIAKHAKKSRRRFANCLEPLNRVVLHLSPKTQRHQDSQSKILVSCAARD
jgi:DNA repair protein RecO (recombination protein O)